MQQTDLQESLNKANLQEAINPKQGEAFVNWAIELLCQGETNENIAILAGLRQPLLHNEVTLYLEKAIYELGLVAQPTFEYFWVYIQRTAQDMVSGDIPVGEGCEQLSNLYEHFEWRNPTVVYAPHLCKVLTRFPALYSDYRFNEKDQQNPDFLRFTRLEIIEEANLLLKYILPAYLRA
jgi:hypothetical protein